MNSSFDGKRYPVIAIVGPTASGKSKIADGLAEKLSGAVISADSMQIYRYMNIGTAKMDSDSCRAPLYMVDVCEPDTAYSAALYQRAARKIIDSCLKKNEIPIICGGTGLYVRAALDVMDFPTGESKDPLRLKLQSYAATHGAEALYERLKKLDPESASVIHPHNVRRVIRAIEMAYTGESYAEQKAHFSQAESFYPTLYFGLTMDRDRLYQRINHRVDEMFEQGLVNEVTYLVERGYKSALTSMQAIGYKEVIDALDGKITLDESRDLIKLRTRRYAKRQLSWFRRDKRITWIDMDVHTETSTLNLIEEALQRH